MTPTTLASKRHVMRSVVTAGGTEYAFTAEAFISRLSGIAIKIIEPDKSSSLVAFPIEQALALRDAIEAVLDPPRPSRWARFKAWVAGVFK